MKQQIPQKRYPRTGQGYQIPPTQRRPLENQKMMRPGNPSLQKNNFKAFALSLLGIVLIFSFFMGKKYYEENKKLTLEKLQEQSENIELDIEYATAKEVLKNIRNKEVQLVDIRESAEFEMKHIESSINIPLSQINEKIGLIRKDALVIIIDRDEESQIGKVFTDHLKKEGSNVKYLEGGILGYSQKGYSLVSVGNPAITEDIIRVDSLSAEKIKNKIKEGEVFVFLDVRARKDFYADNLAGSINIPLEDLEAKKNDLPIGKILVYDGDSIRSFQAAVRLDEMNIMDVHNSIANYETLKKTLTEAAEQAKQEANKPAPTPESSTPAPAETNTQ